MGDEKNKKLTGKQIEGYRQWLAELEEETLETGDADCFDKDIWEIFTPTSPVGRQIYMSYSNQELLDCLLKTMGPPGYQLYVVPQRRADILRFSLIRKENDWIHCIIGKSL